MFSTAFPFKMIKSWLFILTSGDSSTLLNRPYLRNELTPWSSPAIRRERRWLALFWALHSPLACSCGSTTTEPFTISQRPGTRLPVMDTRWSNYRSPPSAASYSPLRIHVASFSTDLRVLVFGKISQILAMVIFRMALFSIFVSNCSFVWIKFSMWWFMFVSKVFDYSF